MPIDDGTVIDHLLAGFSQAGVPTVFITVGRHGNLIRSFCGDGSRWGLEIVYVDEAIPLGSIGPLSSLRQELISTFYVANSDVWCDVDFVEVAAFHQRAGNLLTIVTSAQKVSIEFGVIEAESGTLTGFREKPVETFEVSAGIYCMEPGILDHIPEKESFGFDRLVDSLLAKGEPISVYHHGGRWIDIGRIEDLRRAQLEMARGLTTDEAPSRNASS